MPLGALCFARMLSTDAHTAQYILSVGQKSQVKRIDTPVIITEVVNNSIAFRTATKLFPHDYMS